VIEDIGGAIGSRVLESIGRTVGRAQERRPLPVDLLESDDAYLAVFDAPGAMSSDVQVRFDDGAVVVRIDRFREFHEGFEMQFPGRGLSLDGRVELPPEATVDPSRATATLKDNGTLHVTLPKVETDGTEDADGPVTVDYRETDSDSDDADSEGGDAGADGRTAGTDGSDGDGEAT